MFITSDKWQQPGEFGSLDKYPIYIGNVQRAVQGRLISRTMARRSQSSSFSMSITCPRMVSEIACSVIPSIFIMIPGIECPARTTPGSH